MSVTKPLPLTSQADWRAVIWVYKSAALKDHQGGYTDFQRNTWVKPECGQNNGGGQEFEVLLKYVKPSRCL